MLCRELTLQDVSILTMDDGVFEVLSTAGDTHLGGEDFDQQVVDYFVAKYNKENDVQIQKVDDIKAYSLDSWLTALQDAKTMSKLKREVERAKRTLSSQKTTKIEIEVRTGGSVKLHEQLLSSRTRRVSTRAKTSPRPLHALASRN